METIRPLASSDLRRDKLTGKKVFASDFRPQDLGWVDDCAHALLVRASYVDRPFLRVRTERLSADLQPYLTITATEIEKAGCVNLPLSSLAKTKPFCTPNTPAEYVSQPVAILLFKDFHTYRRAAQECREDRGLVEYGPATPLTPEDATDVLLEKWRRFEIGDDVAHYLLSRSAPTSSQWMNGKLIRRNNVFARDFKPTPTDDPAADALYARLAALTAGPHAVETTTFTQQIDPAFMEPECGLAFLKDTALTLLTGTQSPHGDLPDVKKAVGLEKKEAPTGAVRSVELITVDSGGGFGGRDKGPFLVQLAYAAVFAGRPVRLTYDRFEQFQAGMKRHASAAHSIVTARADGTFDSALVHYVFEGGNEPNLGGAVMSLAALHATGMYKFDAAGAHGLVTKRRVPVVGSMRGFGIPQINFNIETAVDKLAVLKLGQDPILARRANLLRHDPDPNTADCDLAGTPLRFHFAAREVCDAAHAHPLWTNREVERARARERRILRGVGFAGCIQAYGTSSDPTYVGVQLEDDGSLTVWGHTTDMGQGARRSLCAAATRCLSAPARVRLGEIAPIQTFIEQISSAPAGATAASKTAFFHVHVLNETCKALASLRIFPVAREMLGDASLGDDVLHAALKDGAFHLPGLAPLPLAAIAKHLVGTNRERFAIGYGYFRNGWAKATFADGAARQVLHLRALGLARDSVQPITVMTIDGAVTMPVTQTPSGKADMPRSGYAAGGHLIAVEIDPAARAIQVTDAVAFVDAGDPLVEGVLHGQIEGGFQMGLAHAMFEQLPPESGEDRYVNFDRYILPRASDVASIRLEAVLMPLPAGGALNAPDDKVPNIRHKGMGEITMTTVAPALANAIAHALGYFDEQAWPTRLPIRYEDLHLPGELRA